MGVSWVTLNGTTSYVEYGTDANNLNERAVGNVDTYTSAGWVGVIHTATMSDLKRPLKYYYRVGDGSDLWSEVFSFNTLGTDDILTYAVIADMDFEENDTLARMEELVTSGDVQVVIHSGDISYADGYQPHWDVFMNRMEPIVSSVPYMVTPGNHEFWFNFTAYKSRFFMPGVLDAGGSGDNMFYSWDLGFAHFIALNSETALDTANFKDDEVEWVRQNLAAVDRTVTPWVIAHFHRPMYCSNDHACGDGAAHLREQMEDVFLEFGVDLVLVGHVHSYERMYPVYNNTLITTSYANPGAPVYILQGASGNREGNKGSYPPPDELDPWSAHTSTEVGFGKMTVSSTEIGWEFRLSATGEILDEMTLSK